MIIEIFREPNRTIYGYVINFNGKRYTLSGFGCRARAIMEVISRLTKMLKRGDFNNEK